MEAQVLVETTEELDIEMRITETGRDSSLLENRWIGTRLGVWDSFIDFVGPSNSFNWWIMLDEQVVFKYQETRGIK